MSLGQQSMKHTQKTFAGQIKNTDKKEKGKDNRKSRTKSTAKFFALQANTKKIK